MKPSRILGPLAVAVACLLPLAAGADKNRDKLDTCLAETMDPDRRIWACEWLLRNKSAPPDDIFNVYVNLAFGYYKAHQWDRAIRVYDFLLERIPQEEQAYAVLRKRRGDSYLQQGDNDRAIADYDWLLERYPNDISLRNERATAYSRSGQPDRAIAEYEVMMQQMRDAGREVDDALYVNRAHAYWRKRDLDGAAADFDRAIAMKASPRNYNIRAWFHYREGRNAKAATDAERALELDPMNAEATNVLAHLLVVQGQPERAMLTFESAMLLGGSAQIRVYQKALAGHGYKVRASGEYDKATNEAFVACLRAGCRLVD